MNLRKSERKGKLSEVENLKTLQNFIKHCKVPNIEKSLVSVSLTLSAPTPSNRGENDPDLGLQRAKIRNLGLKVTEVFQGFPGFYTAKR